MWCVKVHFRGLKDLLCDSWKQGQSRQIKIKLYKIWSILYTLICLKWITCFNVVTWSCRLQWAYEDSKCSILLCAVQLRELPGIAWKRETAAFIHKRLRHELRRTFFLAVPGFLPLHLWARSGWGVWGSLEKSLMSERIISAYESSSDSLQIPFHSGKKKKERIFSAKEEKKTFNATWQARQPVRSESCQHTLRIELMPYALPVLCCSLSL